LIFPGTCQPPVDCGEEGEPCCEDGAACSGDLECLDDECGCSSDAETTLAPALNEYQDYCTPFGDCIPFADTCVRGCTIEGATVEELVGTGEIPCARSLAFGWSGADESLVYYTQYPLGYFEVESRDWTGTFFSDSSVTHASPVVYIVGVRGLNACREAGPADVGMIAVWDGCPLF